MDLAGNGVQKSEKLLGFISALQRRSGRETAVERELKNFGSLYPQSIDSAPFVERDFWQAYEQVIFSKRHRSVGKETGKTNYIERFNSTLRALSFSFGRENFNRFSRRWKITSKRFGILFITTTHPYLFRTT